MRKLAKSSCSNDRPVENEHLVREYAAVPASTERLSSSPLMGED